MSDWQAQHFSHQEYVVDGEMLNDEGTTIRVVIQINGKTEVDLSSKYHEIEPGFIAFLSRPDDRGIRVMKCLPARGGAIISGHGEATPPPGWVLEALQLPR